LILGPSLRKGIASILKERTDQAWMWNLLSMIRKRVGTASILKETNRSRWGNLLPRAC